MNFTLDDLWMADPAVVGKRPKLEKCKPKIEKRLAVPCSELTTLKNSIRNELKRAPSDFLWRLYAETDHLASGVEEPSFLAAFRKLQKRLDTLLAEPESMTTTTRVVLQPVEEAKIALIQHMRAALIRLECKM